MWDQYGVELFLRQLPSFDPFPTATNPIAFAKRDFEYDRLRLFVLSVLWRAHTTSHRFFGKVRLGPFAETLRLLIQASDAADPDLFSVVLSVFTVNRRFPDIGIPIMDPFRERWSGVNAYRLSFGLVTAYVKVDRAPLPSSLAKMAVTRRGPLFLVERDFPSSPEARAGKAVARDPQNVAAFRKT